MINFLLRILKLRYAWRILRGGSWVSIGLLILTWLFGRRSGR